MEPVEKKKIISIDINGVLIDHDTLETRKGAVELVRDLSEGFVVCLYWQGVPMHLIVAWFADKFTPELGDLAEGSGILVANAPHPNSSVIVDDRGYRFNGDFDDLRIFLMKDFSPYWKNPLNKI